MMKTVYALAVVVMALLCGCARLASYHLDAVNLTDGMVSRAKVVFDNGKSFEWGVLSSGAKKGMWPMPGPLGRSARVEWQDVAKTQHVQQVEIPRGRAWNAIRFILHKDGTVSVETQRK